MNSLKNRFLAYALVLLSSVMMVWGCSDDDDDLPFYGTDTHFLSLSLKRGSALNNKLIQGYALPYFF